MLSHSLVIIGAEALFADVLKTALEKAFDNVVIQDKPEGIGDNDVVLVVIGKHNQHEVIDCCKAMPTIPIMAILMDNIDIDIDENLFEKLFRVPLRLGRVVDQIRDITKQNEKRKTLQPIVFGDDIMLDPRTYLISNRKTQKSVRLTEKETEIILLLSKHLKQAVSRQILLDEVWGYASTVETHTLETHIYRLRQKLKNQLEEPDFLMTLEDGYILNF